MGRAYCSWFCACGNLAETAGDPFRTQSPKGPKSSLFEYVIIIFVVFAVAATIGLSFGLGNQDLWISGWNFWTKFIFASILGVGLYPLPLGNRIWCRYFCPWAGLFGALSKFGKSGIAANDMSHGLRDVQQALRHGHRHPNERNARQGHQDYILHILWGLCRCLPAQRAQSDMMNVYVIIPALNEEGSIGPVVTGMLGHGASKVVVVDNGSTDNTARVAAEAGATVVREEQRGYGGPVWQGSPRLKTPM